MAAERKVREPCVLEADGVPNLRDLGGYESRDGGRVRPGLLFRSAKLTDASPADRQRIHGMVKLVLDFRDSGEIARDEPGRVRAEAAGEEESKRLLSVPHDDFHVRTPPPSGSGLSRSSLGLAEADKAVVRIPIASRPGMTRAVMSRASCSELGRIGVHALGMHFSSAQRKKFEVAIYGVVDRIGMAGLNRCILQYCYEEVLGAVSLICDPANHPVLWHCTHGKDRTALITFFVLSLCNVPREQIFHDYAVTASLIPERLLDQMPAGYSSSWRETPETVIRDTANFLDDRYGGPEAYLEKYGFGPERQRAFARAVLDYGDGEPAPAADGGVVKALPLGK